MEERCPVRSRRELEVRDGHEGLQVGLGVTGMDRDAFGPRDVLLRTEQHDHRMLRERRLRRQHQSLGQPRLDQLLVQEQGHHHARKIPGQDFRVLASHTAPLLGPQVSFETCPASREREECQPTIYSQR